jgi:hypothetical protein
VIPAPPGAPSGGVVPGVALQDVEDISDAVLLQAQWSGELPYHRSAEVPGTVDHLARLLPPGARLRLDQRADHWRAVLADVDGAVVHLRVRWGITNVAVVGAELAPVEALVARLVTAARAATRRRPRPRSAGWRRRRGSTGAAAAWCCGTARRARARPPRSGR